MPRSSTPSRRPSSLRSSPRWRTSPVTSRCCATSCAPTRCSSRCPQGGLNEEQRAAARALALATLTRFRDDGGRPAPPPSDADRRPGADHGVRRRRHRHVRVRAVARGGARAARRGPPRPELAPARRRPRHRVPGRHHRRGDVGPARRAAVRAAGVDFVVLEKNDDVGGTWYENSYPGCRVDNPNHNYSYSFAQRHDWPFHFSSQDVLLDYFRRCADEFGVRDRIRFGTEVLSATWSDPDGHWTIRVRRCGRSRVVDRGERGDQRGRPAEPPVVPAASKGREHVRRPVVPLGAVGPLARPPRQAGGRDRHRRERGAVHPGDRRVGRAPRGVPTDPAVDGADTRVPRRSARGIALALRARAVVQRVESLLDLLEDGRRRAARRAGRSGVGRPTSARSARSTT